MTRLIFMGADSIARVDRVNPYKAQVECFDGYHPITNRSIMRPGDRFGPSIILVWQGREAPEGEAEAEIVSQAALAEADYTKIHRQKPSVSKLWVRQLLKYAHIFACSMLLTFAVVIWGFLIYVVLVVLK